MRNPELKVKREEIEMEATQSVRRTRAATRNLLEVEMLKNPKKIIPKEEQISPKKEVKPKSRKRKAADIENDSSLPNKVEAEDDQVIQIKKKKKVIQLPEDLVEKVQVLKMQNIIKSFSGSSVKEFHKHCSGIMKTNIELLEVASELTVEQADTNIWHELRVGRITASRLHETTRCTMTNGSLVEKFMGKRGGFSFAMMRGTILEEFVFEEVKKEYPDLQRAGFIMHKEFPFFSASPDGLHDDFVLEIKCPGTANTFQQYIDINKLSKKYFAQIQTQMLITGKKKAILAVAHLDFEKTRNITKIWIPFEPDYMEEMMEQASVFYEKAIFPALKKKFKRS